jgi:nucleotide-binding universal stress UspA family protein
MRRLLVVLSEEETDRRLVGEARRFAEGQDATLSLLFVLTEDTWEQDQAVLETIADAEQPPFDRQSPAEYATSIARQVGEETLGDDVEFTALGRYASDDDRADVVLDVARARDCEHVFIGGQKRTPTGKALFGDAAQAVILDFDGFVTVRMHS